MGKTETGSYIGGKYDNCPEKDYTSPLYLFPNLKNQEVWAWGHPLKGKSREKTPLHVKKEGCRVRPTLLTII